MNKLTEPLEILRAHHPLVIEGMSGYDHRDPEPIASHIVDRLSNHWQANPLSKPVALVTQGDPIEKRGISAITRLVSDQLCLPRFMIHLDPHIADYHLAEADQYRVKLKVPYSTLLAHLTLTHLDSEHLLIEGIEKLIKAKDGIRARLEKPPLQPYYKDFAMLQEVTKAACRNICGGITIIQTSAEINQFSVASFFEVGLDLGLIRSDDIVTFEHT